MRPLIIGVVAGVAAMLLMQDQGGAVDEQGGDSAYEEPDLFEQADAIFEDITDMSGNSATADANLRAFMWMLRVSEGTAGPEGYRTLVGGSLFDGYADHPRVKVWINSINDYSSAAGAYQIIRKTWDGVRGKLGLTDFSPASQDAAAVELIRQRGGLALVRAGRFGEAVEKCKKEWASLPGAGYGQHENAIAKLQAAYTKAGGYLA